MNQGQGPVNCRAKDSSRDCCCTICYDKCVCVKLSPCQHKFCSACVVKMTNHNINKCPTCRGEVIEISHIDSMSTA